MRGLLVAALVFVAAANTYVLVSMDHITMAVIYGALVPLVALFEWRKLRRKPDVEPTKVADHMLVLLIMALSGITVSVF
ncbi:hypothetical protein [Enhygromyxa salina]|uniref:Uncharacterized protein n=1 Tax=Enhygromyxa salina TaxID=215803 RepID=A0A2S9YTX4_9BACT|nr:hypothetical protein [Enhygromyxa salina]PRQ08565.1 hypothetical protein ENSA7_18510 [Enhygromyxa salina]